MYILACIFYRLRVNVSLDIVAAAIDWTVEYDYAALSTSEERSPSESVQWQHHVSNESDIYPRRETPWIAVSWGIVTRR